MKESHMLGYCPIQKVDSIKDLGILFDTRLNFKDHIQEKINKAYNMIGLLKRNFIHVDCYTFILLYKALVHPHLEYANSVWSPYKKRTVSSAGNQHYSHQG